MEVVDGRGLAPFQGTFEIGEGQGGPRLLSCRFQDRLFRRGKPGSVNAKDRIVNSARHVGRQLSERLLAVAQVDVEVGCGVVLL